MVNQSVSREVEFLICDKATRDVVKLVKVDTEKYPTFLHLAYYFRDEHGFDIDKHDIYSLKLL